MAASLAQDAGEAAGVDAGDANRALLLQVVGEGLRGAEVRRCTRDFPQHQPSQAHAAGFIILGIDADVADVRVGERHDLLGVGGIREDFLIAGHGGVEHHFATDEAIDANREAAKNRAVGES